MIYRILEWILYRVTRRLERMFGDISDWIRETLDNWDEPSKRQREKEERIMGEERAKREVLNASAEFTARVDAGFPRLMVRFWDSGSASRALKRIQSKHPTVEMKENRYSAHVLYYLPGWETVDMDARLNELNESW